MPADADSSPVDLRLDLEDRKYLRAVVFDSNAFGHARPDISFLEDVARRLHSIGIETWIPEPVAWEWAQHLAEDWQTVQSAMADERRRLRRAGLSPHSSPYADSSAVADAFLERLAGVAHLTVIPVSPENALAGLKDQILLTPSGRRKGDVKTGASDSAWLRAVLGEVGGDTQRLLLVSEDKDISAALGQWGQDCPQMRRRPEVKATMSEFVQDEGGAQNLIVRYLAALLDDPGHDDETLGLGIDPSGMERRIASSLAEYEPDTALYGASLTRLTGLAGITDTYVEAPPAEQEQPRTSELGPPLAQTVLATVFFLADAEATVNRLYNGGDPQVDGLDYDDVLVRVPMSFDIRDGSVTAARTEDEADVSLPDDGYGTPAEAAAALLDSLSAVPGVAFPWRWPEADCVLDLSAGPRGKLVRVEIADPLGQWRFRVTVGTDTAALKCTRDYRAMAGDDEGSFYTRAPYQIEAETRSPASFNLRWALNQWIISHI